MPNLESRHDSRCHLQHGVNGIVAVKHGLLILLKKGNKDNKAKKKNLRKEISKKTHDIKAQKYPLYTCRSLL